MEMYLNKRKCNATSTKDYNSERTNETGDAIPNTQNFGIDTPVIKESEVTGERENNKKESIKEIDDAIRNTSSADILVFKEADVTCERNDINENKSTEETDCAIPNASNADMHLIEEADVTDEREGSNASSSQSLEEKNGSNCSKENIPAQLIGDINSLKAALSKITGNKLIAVDCEGVNLSRKGTLTILTIATENMVYIFDILKLGQAAFDNGLRDILENKSLDKLMFDCRQDSDSLWHQFRVKLAGVLDLQLLEVIFRREHGSTTPIKKSKGAYRSNRRSEKVDDVENIYGYGRCIQDYVGDENLIRLKNDGKKLLEIRDDIWMDRPLRNILIEYCSVDTYGMFPLYRKLKESDDVLPRLRVASERYVDMLRDKEERYYDEFETHAFLPLDIIPEKWTLDFPKGTTKCSTCHRYFPREEFSFTQLKRGDQKCRVCKKIKVRIDVHDNRLDNFMRAEEEEMGYSDCELEEWTIW